MSELDDIFRIEEDRDLFFKIRDWIFATKCRRMEPYESYRQRLSEGERYVILAWAFVAETTNGGIHQFLSNSTGDHAEEAREAMRTIGATLAAQALDAVHDVIFDGKTISSDRALRNDKMDAWEEKHGENSAYRFLDKFDQELGWCESVVAAIATYIRKHREMFN